MTIIIPTRDQTTYTYLDSTIRSLCRQTYEDLSIIVMDSSTDPRAIKYLGQLRKKYPGVQFYHRDNEGIGSALNQALPLVDTEYVMEVDGDNLAMPGMVETLVGCMDRRRDVAGLSCYYAAFPTGDEKKVLKALENGKARYVPGYYYKPLGPCLPLLFFENCQGDANSVFRTGAIRSVGGWPEEKRKGFQDWSLWIKLLAHGYNVDVVRKTLYYYRDHDSSYTKTKGLYSADCVNAVYIKELVENRPEFFFTNCYVNLHRLIRHYEQGDSEALKAVRNSALYMVGVRLGRAAGKSRRLNRLLKVSGDNLKRLLEAI